MELLLGSGDLSWGGNGSSVGSSMDGVITEAGGNCRRRCLLKEGGSLGHARGNHPSVFTLPLPRPHTISLCFLATVREAVSFLHVSASL